MSEIASKPALAVTHVRTEVPIKSHTFKWHLAKFSKLPLDAEIKSPEFHPLREETWRAGLKKSPFSLLFYRITGDGFRFKYNITIQNSDDQVLYQVSSAINEFKSTTSFSAISNMNQNKISELDGLADDKVVFNCFIEVIGKPESFLFGIDRNPSVQDDNIKSLLHDLNRIFKDSLSTDVTLRVKDCTVRAHKAILCSRSAVLHKQLQSKEIDSILIEDMDLDVLNEFITFLYTGTMADVDFDTICNLYYAAQEYDVPSLRNTCVDLLLSKLEDDNACRMLIMAEDQSDEDFKSAVLAFIRFFFEKVVETDGWQELVKDSTELAAEVMAHRCDAMKKDLA